PLDWIEKQYVDFQELNAESRRTVFSMAGDSNGSDQSFNMTILGLRGSACCNAVSQTHRDVTRSMFRSILDGRDDAIIGITNGVHIPSWIAPAMDALFQRYLGADWRDHGDDAQLWENIMAIPDGELWQVRQSLRAYLLDRIRGNARDRWLNQQAS